MLLTLNAPIATTVVGFSRLHLFGKQCGPRSDCSCSGSTLFASILNSSVMLGNYSQQTTSAEAILKCILRVNRRVDKFTPRVQSDHRSGYSI